MRHEHFVAGQGGEFSSRNQRNLQTEILIPIGADVLILGGAAIAAIEMYKINRAMSSRKDAKRKYNTEVPFQIESPNMLEPE